MAELVLNGQITQVLEPKCGISKKNGNEWKLQQYIIEIPNGNYEPKHCIFDVFGDEKIAELNIRKGGYYSIYFDIDAKEYQGRWYNSIRAYKAIPQNIVTEANQTPEQKQIVAEATEKLKIAFETEPVNECGSDCNSEELPF